MIYIFQLNMSPLGSIDVFKFKWYPKNACMQIQGHLDLMTSLNINTESQRMPSFPIWFEDHTQNDI